MYKRVLISVLSACLFVVSCASQNASDESDLAVGELGGMCGGIAGFQCNGDGNYCAYEPGICQEVADAAGVCTVKPQICTMDYRPVCGCDDNTYPNACAAAGAGVSVAYEGACGEEEAASM